MAERRMFSKKIIDTDWFMDMPASTQNLYFHLSMRADDDGFVASPKRIIKLIGATDDDYKILIAKKFIFPFESGICVITDWRINNYLRNDRYTETIYQKEKQTLSTNENGKYIFGIPNVNQSSTKMDTQYSIGKDSIELGKDSINNISCAKQVTDTALKKQGLIDFVDKKISTVESTNNLLSNSISNSKSNINNIEEIIDYLNNKCNTKYKVSTKSTISSINARLNDGYTLEDFKTVIDKKCDEWLGTEMEKYLTPDTLFRPSNFEKYLNQKIVKKSFGFETHNYSKAEINNVFDDVEDVEI